MATLVLTAVGTVLGGPIGGAIGAALGQAVDQNILFKPKGREGPRLDRLDVQTSTYGSQLPQIFGRMRVAGTVIWATDLKETKKKSGGGKGRPSTTAFSYSASFAVALSSRRIVRVGRIWADGNLLRGAAGDFKTAIGDFRLFNGDPDQGQDQLMASAEGTAFTPAHRGTAYALFEDMQLADYGNRIPSLTFEVVADEDEVRIAHVSQSLSGGLLSGNGEATVTGYAAFGPSIADAVEPLINSFDLRLRPQGGRLIMDGSVAAEGAIAAATLARRVNGDMVAPVSSAKQAAALTPQTLSIRYYEAERDYQAGLQRAARPGAGRQHVQIDLPAVVSASQAKGLAAQKAAALWRGRSTLELICGWSGLHRRPGTIMSLGGIAGLWSIESLQWEKMAVRLSLRQVAAGPPSVSLEASSGSAVREEDRLHGPTTLLLADLPHLGDGVAATPLVVAAAAGASAGWRRASLFVEEGDEIVAIGESGAPAVMGTSLSAPGMASAALFDDISALDVGLLDPAMVLAGASDDALLRGTNFCLLGQELLQFGHAVQTGPGQYRLTHLLRGRRGTEWAIGGHGSGENFLLIDAETLTKVPDNHVRAGSELKLLAQGLGDAEPVEAALMVRGAAVKPPSPVHLSILQESGGRIIRWTRRSRAGWVWTDHVDAPLGEEFERYRLRVLAGGTVLREAETATPEFSYSPAMAAEDVAAGGSSLTIEVCQTGALGVSEPLVRSIVG
ncbi:MAG TPA: phage tail protein [Rhizorhapis sp.]|nr:phage tail protein [Rhizorhapis sp.]